MFEYLRLCTKQRRDVVVVDRRVLLNRVSVRLVPTAPVSLLQHQPLPFSIASTTPVANTVRIYLIVLSMKSSDEHKDYKWSGFFLSKRMPVFSKNTDLKSEPEAGKMNCSFIIS